MEHTYYMGLALKEAAQAAKLNEVPIGAVIVKTASGEVIAKGHNLVIKKTSPLMHAEMIAIAKAAKKLQNYRLGGCTIYTTLEPCPMCAGALINARVDSIYFAAFDVKGGALANNAKVLSESHNYNHKPKWQGGICEPESINILQDFFKKLR